MVDGGQEVELAVQGSFEAASEFGEADLLQRHHLAGGPVLGLPHRRRRPTAELFGQVVVTDGYWLGESGGSWRFHLSFTKSLDSQRIRGNKSCDLNRSFHFDSCKSEPTVIFKSYDFFSVIWKFTLYVWQCTVQISFHSCKSKPTIIFTSYIQLDKRFEKV